MKSQLIHNLSLDLFRDMFRIRMIEEALANRYSQQKMRCPVHLSIGQEAIAVGVCRQLLPEDYLISNHRAHAHYLAKGGNLKRMLAEIYGKVDGCSSGRGGSMHLIDLEKRIMGTTPIVGGSLPVGVGIAFATALRQQSQLTTIFFGEAATEEGVFVESINFASLRQLPILFVCENNFYSVYSPLEVRQSPKRSRIAIVQAHGIAAAQGNGNDVEEVYRMTAQAVEYIRHGKGPYFLELDTYRFREHCGPNVDIDTYRPKEEVDYWLERCPLAFYKEKLKNQGVLVDVEYANMQKELAAEIEEAFLFAEQSPFPQFDPNESVYA